MLGDEIIMALNAVFGHADDNGTGFFEIFDVVAKLLGLGGATRRHVFRIEIQYDGLAF